MLLRPPTKLAILTDIIVAKTDPPNVMSADAGSAWGMIGTLVGLVCMLNNMSDPTTIGPKMGVALITTFYGSMLANWVCTPTSNKLQANNTIEMQAKEIMIEGLLSIQAGIPESRSKLMSAVNTIHFRLKDSSNKLWVYKKWI